MELTTQQDRALMQAGRWYKSPDNRLFYLAGYAGTGKTTLARMLADDIGGVLFAAFTGKAASVMRNKGCNGATTLHSLIYRPIVYHDRIEFELNPQSILHDANLLIIDECSMVNWKLGHDTMSFGVPVISIGDPGQLPPVTGEGFFTAGTPDVMLTEIHRQARDNPIIAMATRVREGKRLGYGNYGDSSVKRKNECMLADIENNQIRIAGRNVTCNVINDMWRKIHGRTDPLPMIGDRILCLRNNNRKGLLNGTLWDVAEVHSRDNDTIKMRITLEDSNRTCVVSAPIQFFQTGNEPLVYSNESFRFGYALTVHKAQGSQWDDVLMFDEHGCFGANAGKWLYTGLTRAAKRITVLRE